MKKTILAVALAWALSPLCALAQITWNVDHMKWLKQNTGNAFYQPRYESLLAQADRLLKAKPLSVMDKRHTPANGDKHYYMSLSRYYWPDPTKPNGLPYTDHDGVSNPELNEYDRNPLGTMAERVTTLSLAWYLSGQEKYAQKATEMLRAWFLDKATRMYPNMEYAQMIPGVNGGKGRKSGVLDGYSFVDMLNGVTLMEQSKSLTKADQKKLKAWFTQYLKWIQTSKQGVDEYNSDNNHAVACQTQIIAYAIYTGQTDLAKKEIEKFPQQRVFTQIEPDGRQPAELRRTLAFGYSVYNLTHYIDIYMMAKNLGLSIDKATSTDGRSFYRAMDFLLPYMGKTVDTWPYKQISQWDMKQQELARDMYLTARYLDPSRTDYLEAFRKVRLMPQRDLFYLVSYEPTAEDCAMVQAEEQMKVAVACADSAVAVSQNMAKGLVIPRTISPDGSLKMVGPRDWCSGFFPGELWLMYAYTHDNRWREDAASYTWKIESAKNYRGTHDLGFIFNCSFGRAYELTGEKSYADVMVRAAKSLSTRFNPTVGCIRSWDHNRDKWEFPVIIDNMMNLELMFKATQLTGDSTYWHEAVSHARTTMKNHFRDDYSSFHVVDYDPQTGKVRWRGTHQGYSDDSFWSRGQAWGLYGYTVCYRFTHDKEFLHQAERIARFIMSLKLPEDKVFYWDMKCPEIPNTQRDAAAAAIAASALVELAQYADNGQSESYLTLARQIVSSLTAHYQAPRGKDYGFLLLHSVGSRPSNSEVDVPLNYADYYYLEALMRLNKLDEKK